MRVSDPPAGPDALSRLGLGTAQLGMDYGLTNRAGRTSQEEAARILETAVQAGMAIIDTAAAYGSSEQALGKALAAKHPFRIVTKTLPGVAGGQAAAAREGFRRSLQRLGQRRVDALLVHRPADLLAPGGDELYRYLLQQRQRGAARSIGISAYSLQEVEEVLERYPIDLVQLPLSLFDQRPISNGLLQSLKSRSIEVHVRSVFLQGLLLADPQELPSHFDSLRPQLRSLGRACRRGGLSPLQASLGFVLDRAEVDCAIVGVCSRDQLLEIIQALRSPVPRLPDPQEWALHDEAILNPSKWPRR